MENSCTQCLMNLISTEHLLLLLLLFYPAIVDLQGGQICIWTEGSWLDLTNIVLLKTESFQTGRQRAGDVNHTDVVTSKLSENIILEKFEMIIFIYMKVLTDFLNFVTLKILQKSHLTDCSLIS